MKKVITIAILVLAMCGAAMASGSGISITFGKIVFDQTIPSGVTSISLGYEIHSVAWSDNGYSSDDTIDTLHGIPLKYAVEQVNIMLSGIVANNPQKPSFAQFGYYNQSTGGSVFPTNCKLALDSLKQDVHYNLLTIGKDGCQFS